MLKEYKLIDINNYRKLKFIGAGSFSNVYRVQEKSTGKIYAAKVLTDFSNPELEEINIKYMQIESSIYSRLEFPTIIKFFGICSHDFDNEPYPTFILEYFPNGSLYNIIRYARNGDPLPPKWNNTKKLINIFGIASGMEYIHSHNILHRDLKPTNVLLDDNYYPKLADFGFSKILESVNQTFTNYIGTETYMAPEVMKSEIYSKSVDVYSFSILVYELITNEIPFGQISVTKLSRSVIKGERPLFTKPIPNCYKELITKCWSISPEDRPTFSEIVQMLKNNREFITELNVDEEEYYLYIEYISGEKPYPTVSINDKDNNNEDDEDDEDDMPLSIDIDSFDLNKLERLNVIGEGSFGVVYEAREKLSNTVYATKISKREIYECLKEEYDTVNLIREVMILSKISHPAIIKFIGFSPINFKGSPKPVIITELLKNGTLEDLIEMERKGLSLSEWNSTKKLINIYGIASSMKYLHSLEILHRDLKPSNILVNEYLFPKLADFGLSKDYLSNSNDCKRNKQTNLLGTPIYISPEIYEDNFYSKAGDVYAFGFIVYEIITSIVPSVGNNRIQIMWNISKGIRPSFDCNVPICHKKLIENCWNQDLKKRPSFEEIVEILRNDHNFITEMVDESEYLNYIDFIDKQNQLVKKNIHSIQIQQKKSNQDEKLENQLSNSIGFINLINYRKKRKIWENYFWKIFEVISFKTNEIFLAKMSTILITTFSKEEINGLKKEVNILSTLNHPCLLKFIGYSLTNFKNEQKPIIITEYALNQTLKDIIDLKRKNIKSEDLTDTKMLIIIYGIAVGMSYLHSKDVIHHDLSPDSIFVDDELNPKIADYGNFTKIQYVKSMSSQSSSKIQNVPNYSSPEILNCEEATKASDVYSFALIVYEILLKEKPFNNLKNANQIFFEFVTKSKRPEFPTDPKEAISDCYKELIEACWSQNPNDRPTFDEIVNTLKTDCRFLKEKINKKQFLNYVKSIDDYYVSLIQHQNLLFFLLLFLFLLPFSSFLLLLFFLPPFSTFFLLFFFLLLFFLFLSSSFLPSSFFLPSSSFQTFLYLFSTFRQSLFLYLSYLPRCTHSTLLPLLHTYNIHQTHHLHFHHFC